jgi:hypothetical protein
MWSMMNNEEGLSVAGSDAATPLALSAAFRVAAFFFRLFLLRRVLE